MGLGGQVRNGISTALNLELHDVTRSQQNMPNRSLTLTDLPNHRSSEKCQDEQITSVKNKTRAPHAGANIRL